MAFDLSIASYNSNGLGTGRIEYIQRLIKDYDIVFLQEHWLFDDAIGDLEDKLNKNNSNHSNDVSVYGVSGMEPNTMLCGRPYGGVAFLWKRNLKCHVIPVPTGSRRIACVDIVFNDIHVLMFNVYMPTDEVSNDISLAEYESVLNVISETCSERNSDGILIGGDLNVDFTRVRSTHLQKLKSFIHTEVLKCGAEHPLCLKLILPMKVE